MDASTKNQIEGAGQGQQDSSGERRRFSRIRHDDRGNAYVEWVDVPADLVRRPKLEIERDSGEAKLELDRERSACDPYSNATGGARRSDNATRTDLRKLSEWIKLMRELEERKRNGGEE